MLASLREEVKEGKEAVRLGKGKKAIREIRRRRRRMNE